MFAISEIFKDNEILIVKKARSSVGPNTDHVPVSGHSNAEITKSNNVIGGILSPHAIIEGFSLH